FAAQRVVVAQLSRLKGDYASVPVGEREHQPPLKVVGASARDEPCTLELGLREALLAGLGDERGADRGEPETELPADLLAEAPRLQVRPRRLAELRLPEHPLVERGRLLQEGLKSLSPPALRIRVRGRLLVLERDAESLGEPLDRFHEVEPFG